MVSPAELFSAHLLTQPHEGRVVKPFDGVHVTNIDVTTGGVRPWQERAVKGASGGGLDRTLPVFSRGPRKRAEGHSVARTRAFESYARAVVSPSETGVVNVSAKQSGPLCVTGWVIWIDEAKEWLLVFEKRPSGERCEIWLAELGPPCDAKGLGVHMPVDFRDLWCAAHGWVLTRSDHIPQYLKRLHVQSSRQRRL